MRSRRRTGGSLQVTPFPEAQPPLPKTRREGKPGMEGLGCRRTARPPRMWPVNPAGWRSHGSSQTKQLRSEVPPVGNGGPIIILANNRRYLGRRSLRAAVRDRWSSRETSIGDVNREFRQRLMQLGMQRVVVEVKRSTKNSPDRIGIRAKHVGWFDLMVAWLRIAPPIGGVIMTGASADDRASGGCLAAAGGKARTPRRGQGRSNRTPTAGWLRFEARARYRLLP